MPEVPGLCVKDSRRSRAQRSAKRVVAGKRAGQADVLGSSELHELAEQKVRPLERFCWRQPPDVAPGEIDEECSAHPESISAAAEPVTTYSARALASCRSATESAYRLSRELSDQIV